MRELLIRVLTTLRNGFGNRCSSSSVKIALGALGVYALAWAYLHYFQFLTPHISEADPHFHIKAAWLMRTQGILQAFPWATASMWRETWFNKDFGFHVLLLPFTTGELVSGAKLAAVTYGAAVFASFFAVLSASRVRHAWFWTLLLICAGGFFGYRVNVTRPQLISIIFSLWAMFFVLRRSLIGTAVVTFLYALSYAAPHVAVGYATIFWFADGLERKRWAPWLPLVALGGLLLGWTVHPSFPNTFIGWWVQNVGVLGATWSSGAPALAMAAELQPADTRTFLLEHVPLAALALGAVLLWPHVPDRREPKQVTLLVISLGYLVLTLLSKRFIEMLVPFSLWGLASIYTAAWPSLCRLRLRQKVVLTALLVLVTGFGAWRTTTENLQNFRAFPYKGTPIAAHWLYQNTPRDSVVFTCDWDDAPELFFYNHRNRYLVFLDPAFMFTWRPALWDTWRLLAEGKDPDPVRTITQAFGASGGFCTGPYSRLRRQLEADSRVVLSGQPGGAYVFAFTGETDGAALEEQKNLEGGGGVTGQVGAGEQE